MTASLGAAGCDAKDAAVGTTDADVAATDDVEGDTAPPDMVAPDPCADTTCDAPPGPRCDLHRASRWVSDAGTCRVEGGEPVCDYPSHEEACGNAAVCILGVCEPAPSLCEFPFGTRMSALTLLTPGGQSDVIDPDTGAPEDECCFDFTGDGRLDNGIGATYKGLEPVLGPAGDQWAAFLGRQPVILDLHGLDSLSDDPEVDLIGYTAQAVIDDEHIGPSPLGFAPGTMLPPIAIPGRIEGGVFHGDGGYFRLAVGPLGTQQFIELTRLRVELAVSAADDGSDQLVFGPVGGDRGGRVGGQASQAEILSALNRSVDRCTCTTYSGTAEEPIIDVAAATCIPVAAQTCTEPDSTCRVLTDPWYCQVLVNSFVLDLDTNDDGVLDSLSFGLWANAAPRPIGPPLGCAPR